MTINVSYEIDVEKIAQEIIGSLGFDYIDTALDIDYDEQVAEDQKRKVITEIANQMIIIANNFD